jgi:hypothetical protein
MGGGDHGGDPLRALARTCARHDEGDGMNVDAEYLLATAGKFVAIRHAKSG